MNVFGTIAIIFGEILVVVVGLAAVAFLVREYRLRRERFLLHFVLSFIATTLGFILLFIGQMFAAYLSGSTHHVLIQTYEYALQLQVFFTLFGLIELYVPQSLRFRSRFAVMIMTAVSLVYTLVTNVRPVMVNGLAFNQLSLVDFFVIFFSRAVMALVLILAPLRAARGPRHGGQLTKPDLYMFRAGVSAAIMMALITSSIIFDLAFFVPVIILLYGAYVYFIFFGAAAIRHPSEQIVNRPFNVFSQSLIVKATGLTAVLFWITAFLLMTTTSTYFVSSSLDSRQATLRRDLHYFTKSYSSYSLRLLEQTMRLALTPSLTKMLTGEKNVMPKDISDFMSSDGSDRILRILDQNGVVLYSSASPVEVGKPLPPSRVVTQALGGAKVAAIEKEASFNRWMVRAAVPLVLPDGSQAGVLLGTDVSAALDFSDYLSISPIFAAGYGFISENGEQIYSSGASLDAVTRMSFRQALKMKAVTNGESDAGLIYFLERVYATDNSSDGFFYIYATRAMVEQEIFRILSLVTIMLILSLAAMTAVLWFSMGLVLKPIKQLRSAAARVERDDYDVHVDYRVPDELGELADAFNRMSQTIAERTASLKDALQTERDFLMYTAHELRTPLNIFRWTIELMKYGDTGNLNKEQLELVEQLHQTTNRLIGMVQNLMDAARLEQNQVLLKRASLPVEEIIDEVAGLLSVRAREKKIDLYWKHPTNPLPAVYGDRERIRQVVENLLSNAIKYTNRGGHVEIKAAALEERDADGRVVSAIKITVEDNGIGIPKDQQDHIFTRFYRARNAVKEEYEGTGLGLFIVRQLVELGGGKIWFESEEGSGSSFFVTIPTSKS